MVEAGFLSRLPKDQLHNKAPLRHWAKNKLPETITRRSKKGFGMPISQWLKGPLKDWVIETVTPNTMNELGINKKMGIDLRDRHLSGQADHRKELWTLAVLCHWASKR